MIRKKLTQLNEKGLSYDYINELNPLYGAISLYASDKGKKLFREICGLEDEDYIFKNITFKSYTERYSPELFDYEVGDEVKKIDELSLEIRCLLSNRSEDINKMFNLMNEIYFIIRGESLRLIF